jgi:hypothetical protein
MVPILEDARKRFLKKDGKFIPYRVETFLVPINSMKIYNQVKEGIYKNMNSDHKMDFVQGYSWSGRIERKGEVVYKFSQCLGNK